MRPGQECVVDEIHGGLGLMRRLAEMGLFRGARVKVLSGGPWGGPVYIEILPTGARCSVGHGAASRIMVEPADGIPVEIPGPEADHRDPEPVELCRRTNRARGLGRAWRFWRRHR